jgi:hypothetical protein
MCNFNYVVYNKYYKIFNVASVQIIYINVCYFTGCLGEENEEHLVTYIEKLQVSGFPPTGDTLHKLTLKFSERN